MRTLYRVSLMMLTLIAAGMTARADSVSSPSPQLERVAIRKSDAAPTVDRVVVRKSQRKLYLMRGDTVLRSYRIALGLNPEGHKERSGDFRTPEGKYRLTRRNPRSDFFLSIQVSYPSESDIKRAKQNGWDAGGSIMKIGRAHV